MTIRGYLIITWCAFLVGIVTYAFFNEWFVVIVGPIKRDFLAAGNIIAPEKKQCAFFYWKHECWCCEFEELIWPTRAHERIALLVTRYVDLLIQEDIVTGHCTLQTVLLSLTESDCYLSFDHSILAREWSVFKKWHIIEGLLKTLRENGCSCRKIYFLVNQQPMKDVHLDFSQPWPIDGFLVQ